MNSVNTYHMHLMHTFSVWKPFFSTCHSSIYDCLLVYCEIRTLCWWKMEQKRKQSILAGCAVSVILFSLVLHSLCKRKPYSNIIFMPCGLFGLLEFQLFHSTTSVILFFFFFFSFERNESITLQRKRRWRRMNERMSISFKKTNWLINNLHKILRFIVEKIRPIDVYRFFYRPKRDIEIVNQKRINFRNV